MSDTTALAFDLLDWQKRLGWEYTLVSAPKTCTVTLEKDGTRIVGTGEYLYDAVKDAIRQIPKHDLPQFSTDISAEWEQVTK